MTEIGVRSNHVPRSVGGAAEAVLGARGETQRLKRIFERSHVPMVMFDRRRRYREVNRSARLAMRASLEQMRALAIDDLVPPDLLEDMQRAWARLLDTGCVAGRSQVVGPDGSRLDIVYCGLAYVLPGLHLAAFAPADWPEDELIAIDDRTLDRRASLTPREWEVLSLAADGLSGPELAHELVLSPATVKTHLESIYRKLGVRNRAAAVAKGMRLGVIE